MEVIEIPYKKLDPSTLTRVVEEFVCREGTDYGHQDITLEDKVQEVTNLLHSGKARLMFEPMSQSCSIELKD